MRDVSANLHKFAVVSPDNFSRQSTDGENNPSDQQVGKFGVTEDYVCDGRNCRCKEVLRYTLLDAIETLDGTRRAFKSKQIEALRKKLTRVLIEEA